MSNATCLIQPDLCISCIVYQLQCQGAPVPGQASAIREAGGHVGRHAAAHAAEADEAHDDARSGGYTARHASEPCKGRRLLSRNGYEERARGRAHRTHTRARATCVRMLRHETAAGEEERGGREDIWSPRPGRTVCLAGRSPHSGQGTQAGQLSRRLPRLRPVSDLVIRIWPRA